MTETSRLSTTADALARALAALGDALAYADQDAITACQHVIEATSGDFRAAAVDGSANGDTLTPAHAVAVMTALARCRRLGLSLSLMAGQSPATLNAPRGYSPVGRPVAQSGGGTFLTARG
ncbi:hypothetical protein LuPra_03639 [Luteitalea pratensis]|uniref:Uncharacterized protein n=1 Tax=Luteitalea pratensis TaxID=1855912 RepID=A0A143PRH0_LUTPR|nr:hypothetical protein [Luteitalea pratensis]AMY10409.1 hypothetical protein LuPra_03639 [Luteitalea pratensis]